MAKNGLLPKRLAKCPIPVCTACLYGKATKQPWRTKPQTQQGETSQPTEPGQVVAVDQLISPTPGLIAQMTGFITSARYKVATVFVDLATGHGFIYLQKSTSGEETVEAKKAFERYCAQRGVKVLHYHADNGIFTAIEWKSDCECKQQGLTFTGVGTHHQNGVAERRIKELTHMAQTMLIHANQQWPGAVTVHLWPYALCEANHALNCMPNSKLPGGQTPE